MQLFGDLHILSFVRTNRLDWIGYANRMDKERKVIKYLTVTLRATKKQMVELCTNRY